MDVGFELVFDRRYVINSHQILQLVELIFREVKLILTGAVGIAVGMECRQKSIAEKQIFAVLYVHNRMLLPEELGEFMKPTTHGMELGDFDVEDELFQNIPRIRLDKPPFAHEDQALHIIKSIMYLDPVKKSKFPCDELWNKHLDDLGGVIYFTWIILHLDRNQECHTLQNVDCRPALILSTRR